jgi:hypothetical protein
MTNRTDYRDLALELQEQFGLSFDARDRIETELHNAHVAGQEGSSCKCTSCQCSPAMQEDQAFERLIRLKQDEILACTQRLFDRSKKGHVTTMEVKVVRDPARDGVDTDLDTLERLAFELVKLEDARVIARMQHRRPVDMKAIVAEDKAELELPDEYPIKHVSVFVKEIEPGRFEQVVEGWEQLGPYVDGKCESKLDYTKPTGKRFRLAEEGETPTLSILRPGDKALVPLVQVAGDPINPETGE